MRTPRRVVFDTSSLVSAALKPGAMPHRALLQALQCCDVCASEQTLIELQQVLLRDKFDLYLDRETRLDFVSTLRQSLYFFAVSQAHEQNLQPPCRDPKDNKFLALVQICNADVLVSSDSDLLVLSPWQEVQIVLPAAFLELF